MTRRLKAYLVLMLMAIAMSACGNGGTASTSSGGAAGSGGAGGADAGTTVKPDATYTTDAFDVPVGGDITRCTYFSSTNEADEWVQALQINEGHGHHVVLYSLDHSVEPHSEVCNQGGQLNWVNLAVAQLGVGGITFPNTVGLKLAAHSSLVAEVHAIDASPDPIMGGATIGMVYAKPNTVTTQANVFYLGSMNIKSDPHSQSSAEGNCTVPFPMVIHTGMGHEHQFGTGVHVDAIHSGGTTEHIYDSVSWDTAPVTEYGDKGIVLGMGDSVDVKCDYDNTSAVQESYPSQMCWFFGYHYSPAYQAAQNIGFYCMSAGGGASNACTCIPYGPGNGTGGAALTVTVSRKTSVIGASSRPIYCFGYATGATTPSFYGSNVDVNLTTDTDTAIVKMDDVEPGGFDIKCIQDDVFGGVLPGTGDGAQSAPPAVTIPVNGTATVSTTLDVAVP